MPQVIDHLTFLWADKPVHKCNNKIKWEKKVSFIPFTVLTEWQLLSSNSAYDIRREKKWLSITWVAVFSHLTKKTVNIKWIFRDKSHEMKVNQTIVPYVPTFFNISILLCWLCLKFWFGIRKGKTVKKRAKRKNWEKKKMRKKRTMQYSFW